MANIVSHGDTTIEPRSEKWQRVEIVCPANSFMECAGVQHDSVANVKPCCAYLPEIASNNFINKVSGSGDMLPPPPRNLDPLRLLLTQSGTSVD